MDTIKKINSHDPKIESFKNLKQNNITKPRPEVETLDLNNNSNKERGISEQEKMILHAMRIEPDNLKNKLTERLSEIQENDDLKNNKAPITQTTTNNTDRLDNHDVYHSIENNTL